MMKIRQASSVRFWILTLIFIYSRNLYLYFIGGWLYRIILDILGLLCVCLFWFFPFFIYTCIFWRAWHWFHQLNPDNRSQTAHKFKVKSRFSIMIWSTSTFIKLHFFKWAAKGQLISKCLFGVFNSPKKGTKTIWLEVP